MKNFKNNDSSRREGPQAEPGALAEDALEAAFQAQPQVLPDQDGQEPPERDPERHAEEPAQVVAVQVADVDEEDFHARAGEEEEAEEFEVAGAEAEEENVEGEGDGKGRPGPERVEKEAVDGLAGGEDQGEQDRDLEPAVVQGSEAEVNPVVRGFERSERLPAAEAQEAAQDHAPEQEHPDRDGGEGEEVGDGVIVNLVVADRVPVVEGAQAQADEEEDQLAGERAGLAFAEESEDPEAEDQNHRHGHGQEEQALAHRRDERAPRDNHRGVEREEAVRVGLHGRAELSRPKIFSGF